MTRVGYGLCFCHLKLLNGSRPKHWRTFCSCCKGEPWSSLQVTDELRADLLPCLPIDAAYTEIPPLVQRSDTHPLACLRQRGQRLARLVANDSTWIWQKNCVSACNLEETFVWSRGTHSHCLYCKWTGSAASIVRSLDLLLSAS